MTATAPSDAQLVARCRRGDQDAWAALVERFSRYVHAVIRSYRLGEADGEDVFQETFARTWQHLDRLRDDDAIRSWLGQLARRLCIDRLRATKRIAPEDAAGELGDEDPVLEQVELAALVRDALGDLSPDCQDVLERFFCEEQSYITIAGETGVAAGTVASRISRCLTKLRAAWAAHGGEAPT